MSTRRKQPGTRPTITAPRAPSATAGSAPGYPTFAEVAGPVREHARRLAERLVIAGAAVGLAAAASGCEPPQCQPTRLGEVRVHGETALTDVVSGSFGDAKTELGVGLGIVPHPSMAVAGEMVAVLPAPPPPPAPPTPDSAPPSSAPAP